MSRCWRAAAAAGSLFAVSCRRHPPPDSPWQSPAGDECLAMLDRYVELRVRADDLNATDDRIRELKAKTRVSATQNRSFSDCPREVTRAELECAMSAPNADEIEKCLE